MSERPLVLLTNDDGHLAPNLRALREQLSSWARVVVVAPESEQSATSHSLTLHRPLRLRQVEADAFALDGTPADCVYVGLHGGRALPRRPDLVVSGMNHGANLGADVFYSGTVGGAREGALRGVPSLACSAPSSSDGDEAAARFCSEVARALLALAPAPGGGRGALFNLNVPPTPGPWALRATALGSRLYADKVVFSRDPRGKEYLWIGGEPERHEEVPGSDTEAYSQGVASLTPLILDLSSATEEPLARALAQRVSR